MRERLIGEATRLFAANGYRGTTVGQIEAASGLSPRAGGFYAHFKSKEQIFASVIDRHIEQQRTTLESVAKMLPLGDLRSELTLVARFLLHFMQESSDRYRLLLQESQSFPEHVRRVRDEVIAPGYEQASEIVARFLGDRVEGIDVQALAVIFVGAAINFRTEETLYGTVPGNIDDERFIKTWVDSLIDSIERAKASPASVKKTG